MIADPSLAPHGRASTYGNWGCRCTDCTAAWTRETNARNQRKRDKEKA